MVGSPVKRTIMDDAPLTYHFVFDRWSPHDLPMKRLAEYLVDLAALFGEDEGVHFDRIQDGSVDVVQRVDPAAATAVQERLERATSGDAPTDLVRARDAINARLVADQAVGSIRGPDGGVIVRFPGRGTATSEALGPFRQDGAFEGTLIRIGGRDGTVPVHLADSRTIHTCNADRAMARQMAPHLFGPTLRVLGNGRWLRGSGGHWNLIRFDIRAFEILDDAPLTEVVERLRSIEGSGWRNFDDPIAELQRLRSSDQAPHE